MGFSPWSAWSAPNPVVEREALIIRLGEIYSPDTDPGIRSDVVVSPEELNRGNWIVADRGFVPIMPATHLLGRAPHGNG